LRLPLFWPPQENRRLRRKPFAGIPQWL